MTPDPLPSPRRTARRWRRTGVAVLALTTATAVAVYTQAEHIVLGAEAYLYGYPLVLMDLTRAHTALTGGPENALRRVRQFPDAGFRGVVRPNVDTLYTTAFIDMAHGPWVFEMAANDQRYEVMAFIDGWTNVFAAPGTRTTGTGGGKFLLVPPGWQGTPPVGMSLLRAPTRLVWLIGRTQTNGAADLPLVHRLQDGLGLYRLADAPPGNPASASAAAPGWHASPVPPPPPLRQLQAMDTEAFFTRLALLMADNPPASADGPALRKLARIGIAPGQPPRWGLLDRWGASLGRWIADVKVGRELQKPRDLVRGWSTPPLVLGQFGTHYNLRAVVAMVGLGANLPADAVYPQAQVDARGDALNGSHRYRLHFPAGELPPVRAFWSVTAYGADDFLIDNPLQRHALGDRDPLVYNADGSLDLWIQADPPPAARQRNWLPVRAGQRFLLNARLYWPREAGLDGRWGMPAVERID
jgi:hypothetical protein